MRSASTRAARLKRYGLNLLLALVWIGIPVFAVLALYPVVVDWRDRTEELDGAQGALGRWLHAVSLPTQTRIEQERAYTEGMRAECARARTYYQGRDLLLERSLLDTYTRDPVQVKLKYMRLKADLESKGHYEEARDFVRKPFMPPYAWEQPAQKPQQAAFQAIEKGACIADILVDTLMSAGPCAIGHIKVGDPLEPSERGAEAGVGAPAAQAEGEPGWVMWPVELEFVAPFSSVGTVLGKLTTPPSRCPPVLVHSLRVAGLDRGRAVVSVGLRVLDFD